MGSPDEPRDYHGRWSGGTPSGHTAAVPDPQPLATAYHAGTAAYHAGQPETAHSYTDRMAHEFGRGYRQARKHDRFNATIAARRSK